MIDKANIDFVDGYLAGIANFCHGCDYVPLYGAFQIENESDSLTDDLDKYLKNKCSVSKLTLVKDDAKTIVSYLLNKWVEERIFEGTLKDKRISTRWQMRQHREYIVEFIEDIVSTEYKLYKFQIENDDYGMETEAVCFNGTNKSVIIHFGWWD